MADDAISSPSKVCLPVEKAGAMPRYCCIAAPIIAPTHRAATKHHRMLPSRLSSSTSPCFCPAMEGEIIELVPSEFAPPSNPQPASKLSRPVSSACGRGNILCLFTAKESQSFGLDASKSGSSASQVPGGHEVHPPLLITALGAGSQSISSLRSGGERLRREGRPKMGLVCEISMV